MDRSSFAAEKKTSDGARNVAMNGGASILRGDARKYSLDIYQQRTCTSFAVVK